MSTSSKSADDDVYTARFDRWDICEAYLALENDWHGGGWLRERPSNQRRKEATHVQLNRMQFSARPNLRFETLNNNGKAIYLNLCRRYGFEVDPEAELMFAAAIRQGE